MPPGCSLQLPAIHPLYVKAALSNYFHVKALSITLILAGFPVKVNDNFRRIPYCRGDEPIVLERGGVRMGTGGRIIFL
jgi:hypothetical protein